MPELTEWGNFYVIVGSAGGALIGLQFVVMTLISERTPARVARTADAGAAFGTPNVVHFGIVLLLSAIGSMPWRGFGYVCLVWGIIGVAAMAYTVLVLRRMRTQRAYKPVFEDWLFHALLPFVAYVMLTVSGFIARSHARRGLFFVGAATLLLLFVGIHNAWDAVTYHIYHHSKE
ncbi:MAG TPA: hypothetical protein VIK76_14490 [Pyrinomonadaceae bacterium]|jgi:Na+/melibiose symporter-like transporter